MEQETRRCPHCDGTGAGPGTGPIHAALVAAGRLPAECQNCDGTGEITVRRCVKCDGEFVADGDRDTCRACLYIQWLGHTVV